MNMEKKTFYYSGLIAFFVVLLSFLPFTCFAEGKFGGLTFTGERKGVCIEIDGKCAEESISFELDTCDENQVVKERYKDKMPFTLLVPAGTHKMIIKKNGKEVLTDDIHIKAEEVLDYKLP